MNDKVVILIPGTKLWRSRKKEHGSADASWTAEGSPFRSALEAALGQRVHFECLDWRRRNKHSDREEAAKELSRLLSTLRQDRPASEYYIVGHSHGGSVAWMAMNSGDSAVDAVAGIICVGTPFVCFNSTGISLRAVEPLFAIYSASILGFSILLLPILVISIWLSPASQWPRLLALDVLCSIGITLLAMLYFASKLNVCEEKKKQWKQRADTLLGESSPKPHLHKKVKIIRSVGDETGALAFLHVMSWASSRLSELLDRRYFNQMSTPPAKNKYAFPIQIVTFGCFVLTIPPLFMRFRHDPTTAMHAAALTIMAASGFIVFWTEGWLKEVTRFGAFFMTNFVVAATFLIRCFATLGILGQEYLFCSLYVDVMTEAAPPGDWMITQLGARELDSRTTISSRFRLAHSIADDPRLPTAVADWILDRSSE